MATRREQMEVGLLATDRASAVLKAVADEIDKLDGETADVDVTAEDKATAEVRALMQRIDGLTDDDKKVILTAEAAKLEKEVKRATILLGQVDGETAEAVLEARNNTQTKLDAVNTALTDIDSRTVDATVEATDKASDDVQRVDDKLDALDRRTVDPTIDAKEGTGLADILGKIDGVPDTLTTIGTKLSGLTGPGGAALGFVGALAGAAVQASETALTVDDIARFTGSSYEEASKLWSVWSENKLEVGDLLDIVAQMQGALEQNPGLARQLGISMDEVRRNPLQALITAIDLLNSDQLTANQRILIGSQLFGEEGVRQINGLIAAVGPEGLQGAIDDVDASRIITEEDVRRAREFQQNWRDLTNDFRGLALSVGPSVLGFFADLAGGLGQASDLMTKVFGGDFAGAWDQIWNSGDRSAFEEVYVGFERVSGFYDDFRQWIEEGRGGVEKLSGQVGVSADALNDFIDKVDAGVDPEQAWNEAVVASTEAVGDNAEATADAADATRDHTEAVFDQKQATEDATRAHEAYIDALEEERDLLDDQIGGVEDYAEAHLNLEKRLGSARDAHDAYREAVEEHGEASDEATEAARRARDAAIDVAAAQVALMEAENRANGVTTSRVEAIDRENRSLLTQASNLNGPARDAILAHILRINGIPEERVTEILADADPDNLAQVEAELDGPANKRRVAAIEADADDESIRITEERLNRIANTPRTAFIGVRGPGASVRNDSSRNPIMEATGNPYTSEGWRIVGEQGPEFIRLPGGAEVVPNHRLSLFDDQPRVVHHSTTIINVPRGVDTREYLRSQRDLDRRTGGGYRR